MCGRYFIDDGTDSGELRQIIQEINRQGADVPVKTSGEIYPTDVVPVIAMSRGLSPKPFAMGWGYTLPGKRLVFNARSETAAQRPLFRDGMLHRRCAVPATRYFEWTRGKDRVRYAIRPTGADLFYMAGIYRLEEQKPVFSILTTESAEDIAFIHDRMPVILPAEIISDWVNPKYGGEELLKYVNENSCAREAISGQELP